MPLYEYRCEKCGFIREEIKKVEDLEKVPFCVYCKDQLMERVFSPVATVLRGPGWSHGDYAKLRERSKEQGKKFFKRHPDLQVMAEKSVTEKPTL